MELGDYVNLVKEYPRGKSINLNLSSNFKIGLGIEHKDFCDAMISSGNFSYQSYAPKYNQRDSYLLWHEGEMEIRIVDRLVYWYFDKTFDEKTRKNFKITVQTNSDDAPIKKNLDFNTVSRHMIEYLLEFIQERKLPMGIPRIYYNPPFEQDSILWLPNQI